MFIRLFQTTESNQMRQKENTIHRISLLLWQTPRPQWKSCTRRLTIVTFLPQSRSREICIPLAIDRRHVVLCIDHDPTKTDQSRWDGMVVLTSKSRNEGLGVGRKRRAWEELRLVVGVTDFSPGRPGCLGAFMPGASNMGFNVRPRRSTGMDVLL